MIQAYVMTICVMALSFCWYSYHRLKFINSREVRDHELTISREAHEHEEQNHAFLIEQATQSQDNRIAAMEKSTKVFDIVPCEKCNGIGWEGGSDCFSCNRQGWILRKLPVA